MRSLHHRLSSLYNRTCLQYPGHYRSVVASDLNVPWLYRSSACFTVATSCHHRDFAVWTLIDTHPGLLRFVTVWMQYRYGGFPAIPCSKPIEHGFGLPLGECRWAPVVLNIWRQPWWSLSLFRFTMVCPFTSRNFNDPTPVYHGWSWLTKPWQTGTPNRDCVNGA
jgi:hypothetical protein